MLQALILVALMILLVVALGLPLLLSPDSRAPEIISFCILTAFVAAIIWSTEAWWVLVPVLALILWVVRLDGKGGDAAAGALDRRGWSARTRLRFRLWCAAIVAFPLLLASLFVLPFGSAVAVVIPCMAVSMTATTLFRFSFYRSALRDYEASP